MEEQLVVTGQQRDAAASELEVALQAMSSLRAKLQQVEEEVVEAAARHETADQGTRGVAAELKVALAGRQALSSDLQQSQAALGAAEQRAAAAETQVGARARWKRLEDGLEPRLTRSRAAGGTVGVEPGADARRSDAAARQTARHGGGASRRRCSTRHRLCGAEGFVSEELAASQDGCVSAVSLPLLTQQPE